MTPRRTEGAYPTQFDWAIYADATLAGLAQLIPIPFVDSLIEEYFRRRMPVAIARRNQRPIHAEAVQALNAGRWTWRTVGQGCLLLPFRLLLDFLLRFVRKIVYVLTIKKAVDALNIYWQRAFLLDHMIRMGHLREPAQIVTAVGAMEQVLAQANKSPLRQLARQLIYAPLRIARAVWRVWRGRSDQTLEQTRSQMARAWGSFGNYFAALAQRYDETYLSMTAATTAAMTAEKMPPIERNTPVASS